MVITQGTISEAHSHKISVTIEFYEQVPGTRHSFSGDYGPNELIMGDAAVLEYLHVNQYRLFREEAQMHQLPERLGRLTLTSPPEAEQKG